MGLLQLLEEVVPLVVHEDEGGKSTTSIAQIASMRREVAPGVDLVVHRERRRLGVAEVFPGDQPVLGRVFSVPERVRVDEAVLRWIRDRHGL